jgi:hypothetical protein
MIHFTMSEDSIINDKDRSLSGHSRDAFEDGPGIPPKTSQDKKGTKAPDLVKKQLYFEKSAKHQVLPQFHVAHSYEHNNHGADDDDAQLGEQNWVGRKQGLTGSAWDASEVAYDPTVRSLLKLPLTAEQKRQCLKRYHREERFNT